MNIDILDKIEKLSKLKDKNIITEEEFKAKKQILLDSIQSSNEIKSQNKWEGTYWLPVPSMILGIFTLFACFDENIWDKDALLGASFFIIISLTLGIISVSIQNKGKAMAIAGITLSILAGLTVLSQM